VADSFTSFKDKKIKREREREYVSPRKPAKEGKSSPTSATAATGAVFAAIGAMPSATLGPNLVCYLPLSGCAPCLLPLGIMSKGR
jgi:hypothetical protein